MTAVNDLLRKLFKLPRILLVTDAQSESVRIATTLNKLTECTIDHYSGQGALPAGRFDLIFVDAEIVSSDLLSRLKESGPLVVTSRSDKVVVNVVHDGPVTMVAKPVSERDLVDVFRLFKIKTLTQDVAECLRTIETTRRQKVSGKFFAGSVNEIPAT
jgi:hypothetical protein